MRLAIACALVSLLGGMICLLIEWLVHAAGNGRVFDSVDAVPPRQFALVLGTAKKLKNGKLNRFYAFRIEAAAELFRAGRAEKLILSGSARGTYDEPDEMRKDLLERGIPAEALILDRGGARTFASVCRARDHFGIQSLCVVSQEFHNRRALFFCRHRGIDAIGYNAKTVPSAKTWRREWAARLVAIVDVLWS